jgi:hypothetical protein
MGDNPEVTEALSRPEETLLKQSKGQRHGWHEIPAVVII